MRARLLARFKRFGMVFAANSLLLWMGPIEMKPNWVVLLCGVVMVAASFSISFAKGADAVARDAAKTNDTQLAQTL